MGEDSGDTSDNTEKVHLVGDVLRNSCGRVLALRRSEK